MYPCKTVLHMVLGTQGVPINNTPFSMPEFLPIKKQEKV